MEKIVYVSVEETARKWRMSERSVRNYCSQGRIEGAILEGNTWKIPSAASKPARKPRHAPAGGSLLAFLKREKEAGLKGGIYHRIQVELTYNSNHIEGSRLTRDETRHIFETKTLGGTGGAHQAEREFYQAASFRSEIWNNGLPETMVQCRRLQDAGERSRRE